jgi:hypothetical protein
MISTDPQEDNGNPDLPLSFVHIFRSPDFQAEEVKRDFEPRLHFRTLSLQRHFARQGRRRTRGPTSLKKGTATVALRELGNKWGTVAGKVIL